MAVRAPSFAPVLFDAEGPVPIIKISELDHTASALPVYASCRPLDRLRKTRYRRVASRYRVGL